MISVLLEATEKTQKPFLNRALNNEYLNDDFQIRARENVNKIVIDILQRASVDLSVNIFNELFSHFKMLETNGNVST